MPTAKQKYEVGLELTKNRAGTRGKTGHQVPGLNLVHPGSLKQVRPTNFIRDGQAGRGIKLPDGVAERPKVG